MNSRLTLWPAAAPALAFMALWVVQAEASTKTDDVVVYHKLNFDQDTGGFQPAGKILMDTVADSCGGKALRLRRTEPGGGFGVKLPVDIEGATDLKIAYLCKAAGVPRAGINVFDAQARDNTTSNAYRWLSEDRWSPVMYYVDTFRYNSSRPDSRIRMTANFKNIYFHGEKKGHRDTWMLIDNFAVYRGDDRTPPDAVKGLKAEAAANGIQLSWAAGSDNVSVMLYVISRADGPDAAFRKVAESFTPQWQDRVSQAGVFRYRVLACDFEENLGDWSAPVTVQHPGSAPRDPQTAPAGTSEREGYRQRVREIARKGSGKVNRNYVLCFGDSLTGATGYRHEALGALGIKMVTARGYTRQRTSFGRAQAQANLDGTNPYMVLVLFGTNNRKNPQLNGKAMEDLTAIAETAAERGTIPILGTIPPRGFSDPRSRPEAEYNKALIETCRKLKIPCGHLFEEYQRHPNKRHLLAGDGIHNTRGGMIASARAWRRVVEEVHFALRDRP